DAGDVQALAALARPGRRVPVHIKIDTGMSRLGVAPSAFESFLENARNLATIETVGLCTHLACADGDDAAPTLEQLARFDRCLTQARAQGVEPALTHAANSAGAVRFPDSRYDLVRPGIALYGDAGAASCVLPGAQPVLRLTTRVLAVRDLAP